jgi:hypothetical protein
MLTFNSVVNDGGGNTEVDGGGGRVVPGVLQRRGGAANRARQR